MRKYKQQKMSKFDPLIEELMKMPEAAEKDENSERWLWFRKQDAYEEILEIVSPPYKRFIETIRKNEKFLNNTKLEDPEHDTMDQNFGTAASGGAFDDALFFEAVVAAVNRYRGYSLNSGEPINLATAINEQYKTRKWKESSVARSEERDGMGGYRNSPKEQLLYKVITGALKIYADYDGKIYQMDFVAKVKNILGNNNCRYKYTDEEITDMIRTVDAKSISKDYEWIEDDNNSHSMEEYISDGENPFEDLCRTKSWGDFLEQEFAPANFQGSKGKIDRALLIDFLSRDMLVQLKTYELEGKLRKENVKNLEEGCKTWCPKWNECKISSPKQCRIRFGTITNQPREYYCNMELYDLLKECREQVFNFLNNDYIRAAFMEQPKSLEDICSKKLKDPYASDENDFKFTNRVMAREIGFSEAKISRSYEKYCNVTRGELLKIFKEKYLD